MNTVAADRALAFLAERQQPSGGFEVRMSLDLRTDPGETDPSLFATAFVARALAACGARGAAPAMHAAACDHLLAHMEPGGVWRHWTSDHPQHKALPVDADDTACIASVLAAQGLSPAGTDEVLLANIDALGRFRTWVVPHWPPPRSLTFWRVAARRLRHPLWSYGFWKTSADPGDIDGVVNAHVLHRVGDGPHAAPVVAFLADIVRRGAEGECDKWYRSPAILHAALARSAAGGVGGLEVLRDEACARLLGLVREDGTVGDGDADAALVVLALASWDAAAEVRGIVLHELVAHQRADGSWPAEPVYFGGPRHHPAVPAWGSEELTTGLCLEALVSSGA